MRTARDDERKELHQLGQQAFAASPTAYDEEADRTGAPLDRRHVATDDGKLVGRFVVWELGQWFGGQRVPMGGVSGVAVAPSHRGRGVGTALVEAALPDMRAHGEVISTLYPMNHTFYRRHGWEVAGAFPEQQVELRALLDLPEPKQPVTLRPAVEADLPGMRQVQELARRPLPGSMWLSEAFARRRMLPHQGVQEAYVAELDGEIVGSITLARQDRVDAHELYALTISSFAARDLDAELTLWALVTGNYPVTRTVRFVAPQAYALPVLLGERDVRPFGSGWCWMTRLVDAAGAIAARGYLSDADVEVHLDLADRRAPWNAGRHVLRVKDGEGALEPGGRGAVALDIGQLSSVYTGWADPQRLAKVGLLTASDSDVDALARAFAGRTPWAADFF